ncbi:alpha/beta fold hydrolase [Streptomyces durhamensis]|uniref:alpha/beta fold hydrolase n=1 Tax=Streptomyces durhamensis TaxID=68194 RepID=UPI001ADFE4B0|nr:alpha/beta fold hydrolase [Streptomyces durhamensis]
MLVIGTARQAPATRAEIAYDEAGSGEAVVFVHAGCADRRMWDAQFTALAAGYRVIRYDWRGRGASADAVGEFGHHLDLIALMDERGVRRAAVVGASDGGGIALDAALTRPDRFRALVLVAPGLSGHQWPRTMVDRARRRLHAVVPAERLRRYEAGTAERIEPADLDAVAEADAEFLVAGEGRDRTAVCPEVWRRAVEMGRLTRQRIWSAPRATELLPRPPARERLAQVTTPTLVISGLCDVPEIREVATLLQQEIPGARHIELPDTGHLPSLERPVEVTAALEGFFASLGGDHPATAADGRPDAGAAGR